MKILLVDDDPMSIKILESTLSSLGHETVVACNGLQALEKFKSEPVRIIISDWVMPEMDGLELCRNIRRLHQAEYTYFIMLTVRLAEKQNLLEATHAGVDDFLTKPLDKETIWMRLYVAERILEYTKQIRTLKNFLPICMYCKKIRNDENYWQQLESYIQEQTGSTFTHGICPDCYQKAMQQIGKILAKNYRSTT
ncbi:MAG: response regulator [Acidobacteriota bacterium]|nr:response regulator [Blastocatellia bacterium]MDW8411264.1 response regulator [Acidobacteriota bacterium]